MCTPDFSSTGPEPSVNSSSSGPGPSSSSAGGTAGADGGYTLLGPCGELLSYTPDGMIRSVRRSCYNADYDYDSQGRLLNMTTYFQDGV